jgi:hypothetical protein
MAALFPDAKILIVLRNPSDRAFSLYQWMVREGYEYMPTFEKALAAEEERMSRKLKGADLVSPSKQAYLYFRSGLYSAQIMRFFDQFPRERVLVLKYENLAHDPLTFMRRIYLFLGVDPDFVPKMKVHNLGNWPLSPGFQYFCRRRLMRFLPNSAVALLMKPNMLVPKKMTLDPKLRADLLTRYAADIKATEEITGLDLKSWFSCVA